MGDGAITLVNAEIAGSSARTLRMAGSRIVDIGGLPRPHDRILDLRGDRLLPGLINAHDHLQLNGFSRLKYRERYQNACEWIADIDSRLNCDPHLLDHRGVPRDERLLLGGVKNMLSGVTTVAHHDPLYPFLTGAVFPTRVVTSFGWSHSLLLDGAAEVQRSHDATPADHPWIIHAAEGVDAAAATEFDALTELGCMTPNTILVHALGLDPDQQRRLARAGAGMVWCPASNLTLFGATADVRQLIALGRVALGTDSRISGARDLLAELQVAREISDLDENTLESLVTTQASRLLRLADRGMLCGGALADLLVIPSGTPLWRTTRADIRLLILDGRPCYGDPHYAAALDCCGDFVAVRVDGRPKFLRRALVRRLACSEVREPGLEWEGGDFHTAAAVA